MSLWNTVTSFHPICAVVNTRDYLRYSLVVKLTDIEHSNLIDWVDANSYRSIVKVTYAGFSAALDNYRNMTVEDISKFHDSAKLYTTSGYVFSESKEYEKYLTHLDKYVETLDNMRSKLKTK